MPTTKLKAIPQSPDSIILVRTCPICGKEVRKEVPAVAFYSGIDKYQSGTRVQAAFPTFDSDTREMILTGICSECWNNM